jgi:hypothetical protein
MIQLLSFDFLFLRGRGPPCADPWELASWWSALGGSWMIFITLQNTLCSATLCRIHRSTGFSTVFSDAVLAGLEAELNCRRRTLIDFQLIFQFAICTGRRVQTATYLSSDVSEKRIKRR